MEIPPSSKKTKHTVCRLSAAALRTGYDCSERSVVEHGQILLDSPTCSFPRKPLPLACLHHHPLVKGIARWQCRAYALLLKRWSNIGPNARRLSCRARSKLRSESVGAKSYRFWGPPGCRCRWRAEHPQQPAPGQSHGYPRQANFPELTLAEWDCGT